MTQSKSIDTRPVSPQDDDFIYEVYAGTRAAELSLAPWPDEQKNAFVRMQFELRARQYCAAYPEAMTEIILYDGVPVGTMIVLTTADEICLVDIALLAEFRGSGIGTAILRGLQKEGKKIILHVLKQNPAAHLYARLGFAAVTEDSMYLGMEWSP